MKKQQATRSPRFGAYIVTRRTAVHKDLLDPQERRAPPLAARPATQWQTLWAEKPLDLPQGRVLGVRKRDEELQVAWVPKATLLMKWQPAAQVLTSRQVQAWLAGNEFLPT
jgi:hypothetical protein